MGLSPRWKSFLLPIQIAWHSWANIELAIDNTDWQEIQIIFFFINEKTWVTKNVVKYMTQKRPKWTKHGGVIYF